MKTTIMVTGGYGMVGHGIQTAMNEDKRFVYVDSQLRQSKWPYNSYYRLPNIDINSSQNFWLHNIPTEHYNMLW